MRPNELVIDGFRSYGQRTRFGWRDRSLVGIVGPIGSGKSSILDAVAFALYSKTPAFEKEKQTLINQRRDSARVELGFEVDGEHWRAIRVIRRRGASKHVLQRHATADHTAGRPLEVIEKEGQVNQRIVELLGLDFHALCRSVLLAQNRFAEFLQATPAQRDQVLKGVFGFERVDLMHAVAKKRARVVELTVSELTGKLSSSETDRRDLAEAKAALEHSTERVSQLESIAEQVERLQREIGAADTRSAASAARLVELEALDVQLPDKKQLAKLRRQAKKLELDAASATTDHEAAAAARGEAEAALSAEDAALPAQTLAEADDTLHELTQQREAARIAEVALNESRAAVSSCERRATEHRAAEAAAKQGHDAAMGIAKEAEQHLQRVQVSLQSVIADGLSDAMLREARLLLPTVAQARAHLDEARRQDTQHRQRVETLRRMLKTTRSEAKEARAHAETMAEAAATARAAASTADAALQHARHAKAAATLRAQLEVGAACPVCDQPVAALPPGGDGSGDLEQIAGAAQQAAQGAERAAEELASAREVLAAATQAVCSAEQLQAESEAQGRQHAQQVEQREQQLGQQQERLRALIGEGDPAELLPAAEQRLADAQAVVASAIEQHQQSQQQLTETRHQWELCHSKVEDADNGLEQARALQTAASEQAAGARVAATATSKRLAALLGLDDQDDRHDQRGPSKAPSPRKSAVFLGSPPNAARIRSPALRDVPTIDYPVSNIACRDHVDPVAQLTTARERRRAVEQRLQHCQQQQQQLAERLREAMAELQQQQQREAMLQRELSALAGQLLGARFDPDIALAALHDQLRRVLAEQRDAAAEQQASSASDRARASASLEELIAPLAGQKAQTSYAELFAEAREAHRSVAGRVEELQRRVEQAATLKQMLDEQVCQRDLYRQLTIDLSGPKFLRYLLDEERATLSALGSDRFETLSGGRYRFSSDGSFAVTDLAAAEAERRSDTLSGGELFLASLALALALAEKVTRSGGRLDAFFLDEGFGSLDAEHLDLALDGIERLVLDAPRRLVVVVSHVPSLRDRVEDLIELDKDPLTGDTVVVRGAG